MKSKLTIKDWTLLIYFLEIDKGIVHFPNELLKRFDSTNEELNSIVSFWTGKVPELSILLNKNSIINDISKSFEISNTLLPGKGKIYIMVLPTFDEFILKNLFGCSGYVVYKDTIWLYINPNAKSTYIQQVICHEYNHLKRREIYKEDELDNTTLKESLIADGLSEHFKEKVMETERAEYTKVINDEEISKLLNNLKDKLETKDKNIINEIFFGSESFKNGTGYTVGYYLVNRFLRNHPNLGWSEIMKVPTNDFYIVSKN